MTRLDLFVNTFRLTYSPEGKLANCSILLPKTACIRFDGCRLNVPSRLECCRVSLTFKSPERDSINAAPVGLRRHSATVVSIWTRDPCVSAERMRISFNLHLDGIYRCKSLVPYCCCDLMLSCQHDVWVNERPKSIPVQCGIPKNRSVGMIVTDARLADLILELDGIGVLHFLFGCLCVGIECIVGIDFYCDEELIILLLLRRYRRHQG